MVSHGSYLQPSKDLQGLPIKTLLKHFWCCQQQRAEIAQPLRRCYLPPATPVLSILWAGRYKISNNLISTSKFYRLSELAALLMWVCRNQGRGPLRERKIWVKSWPPSLQFIHGWLKTPALYTLWRTTGITGMEEFRTLLGTTWSVAFLNRVVVFVVICFVWFLLIFKRSDISRRHAVWASPT